MRKRGLFAANGGTRIGGWYIMISQQSERLLSYLKGMPFLAGYNFSIYKPGLTMAVDDLNRMLCREQKMSHLCRGLCVSFLSAVSEEALNSEKSVFFRCPRNRFVFAIPLSGDDSCLVCGGEPSVDTERKAQEMILAIKRLITTFISGEKANQVGASSRSYDHRQGQRGRQCRR